MRGYCVDIWWQTELAGPTIGTHCTMAVRPGKAGVAQPGVVAEIVKEDGTPSGIRTMAGAASTTI
jgi:acetyl-CoA synthetase